MDGCFVSNEFPCFQVIHERLDPGYVRWYFHREASWNEALGLSEGATPTSRNRLKEQRLLAMRIPLPPLAEQRRIVAKLDLLAAKIHQAKGLTAEVDQGLKYLSIAMAHRMDLSDQEKLDLGWKRRRLGDCIRPCSIPERVETDREYPNLGIYSFGRGLFHKPPIQGIATSASTLFRVRKDQFIYSRLFAFEGAYGLVSAGFDGCYVSNEYPTFDCDQSVVLPEFVWAYFQSPTTWSVVATGSKGLGDRRQRVQPQQVLEHELLIPPITNQLRIVEVMQPQYEVAATRENSAAELDALLPALLDRAFKGQL